MRRIPIYVLLFTFITASLSAHRVILKSGEVLSGELKETEGASDHIILNTEDEDIKIFKKDVAEIFFEESGNHLCMRLKKQTETKCGLKLLKLNSSTVYYIDENNRYLRASFKDLESITIEAASTKVLEQFAKAGFSVLITSKDKKEVRAPIAEVNENSVLIQKESEPVPTEITRDEISTLHYKTAEEEKEISEESTSKEIRLIDYLIPGYYIRKQGYVKSGTTLMGLTAFLMAGSVYEFMAAKNSEGKTPVYIPQSNGSILWAEQANGEFEKHKQLNQLFLISLACTYLFNAVLLTFPVTFAFFFHDGAAAPAINPSPELNPIGKDQKIEMKININF
ncbi:LB_137 family protein [Leptospira sanjuanensis]|uniref:LB_137 family protein n=1 Tax=Leptospira sanjuanensis TaxID=2879643 RepID=UPI001EE997F9|nr:hypothetical protein [Leptospira sanjuanensis]MCG6169751.1 hypothetical protein [Leptospira sanjuanensis]